MNNAHPPSLGNLVDLLRPYDVAHLLSSSAALQLFPRNADQAVRLQVLAHAAATLPWVDGKPQISSGRLRQICESKELAAFVDGEDPCDEMFVEEIPFFGGSFRVMPGITESGTFILHHLSKAIFLNTTVFPDRSFVHFSRQSIGAALTISDEIAKRAGLVRKTEPVSAFREPIVVPDAIVLNRLRSAVVFEENELARLLEGQHIALSCIQPYVLQAGDCKAVPFAVGSSPLHARPIVRVGNKYVAASPSSFLAAARHATILRAIENGVVEELARRYCRSVWDTVKEALGFLQQDELHIAAPPGWENRCRVDGIFAFDTDKVLYAMLATDPFTGYSAEDVYGHWNEKQLRDDVQSRFAGLEKEIFQHLPWVNEILMLFLFQGAGRAAMLGFTKLPEYSRFLAMTATDLDTIALLEVGDPLVLWKYAGAAREIRDKTHLIVTGELDEFHLFRNSKYSYYIGDDARPNVFYIPPGSAGNLRREVARARDWHAVPSYRRGYVRQVTAIHDTGSIPIYTAYPPDSRFSLLVEGLPAYVWITVPANIPEDQAYLSGLYRTLVDGLAYWVWQFTPFLKNCLDHLKGDVLLVELTIIPGEAWKVEKQYTVEELAAAFTVTAKPESNFVSVAVGPALNAVLGTSDNAGERKIIASLLQGFGPLLPEKRRSYLSDHAVGTAIEKFAPLGLKKKLLLLHLGRAPQLDRRDIPRYRLNQEADASNVLDRLGSYLSATYQKGDIPAEKGNELVKESVKFFIADLERLLKSLSPEGLLEYLIAQHEAVVRQEAFSRLTVPTRLFCYGSEPKLQEQLQDEIPDLSAAALAGRFLIELATVVAPHGLRPISLSCFDEMRSLSIQIINDGMLSDLLHFGLFDLKLSMLASGRRGIDAVGYRTALDSHIAVFAAEQISRSAESFARHWKSREPEPSEFLEELDAAVEAELGHSLTDILTFLTAVIQIGYEAGPGVASMETGALLNRVTSECDLSRDSVAAIFNLLALRERNSVYQVPPPFRAEDTYPWRFNRALSYLRRPLIVRKTENGEEVLWGNRHVDDARRYLVQICSSGRIRAQSPELRRVIGKIHNKDGDHFNNRVADFFSAIPGMLVKSKFKKLKSSGGVKRPPGDIDVLVLDTAEKNVYPIECKSLSAARTPFELATELDEMLGTAGSKSMIEKHARRVEWCRAHMDEILNDFRVELKERWSIQPFVIVAQPLLTPELRKSPIPIMTFEQLRKTFTARPLPR